MRSVARDTALGGYRPVYHPGARCPGCGARGWHIGRQSAECASCSTALPLAPSDTVAEGSAR